MKPIGVRGFRLGAAVLAVLALGLGLLRLSYNDVWFDEAASLLLARQSGLGFFRTLLREDTHGPVYYGLLKLWILVFGEGAVVARLPSVLCAAGAVYVVAHLGAKLFGRRLGLVAALLVALSPFHLYYAQEVRFHSFIELSALLHLLCFLQLIAPPQAGSGRSARWPFWGFVITGAACALTFYLSGLLMVAEAIAVVRWWKQIPRRRVLAAFATLVGVGACWVPALIWQIRHTHGSVRWIPDRPTWTFLAQAGQTFTAGRTATWVDHVVTAILAVAAGAAVVHGVRGKDRGPFVLACWFAVPLLAILALSSLQPLYEPRYLFMILPAFFLLAAAGLWRLRVLWLRLPVFAVILAVFALADVRQYRDYKFNERWRDAAAYVRKEAVPSDVLVAMPSHEGVTLSYYFPDFKRRRGINLPFEVNRMLVRGSRLWLFTYRDDYRLRPGDLTPDAMVLESRNFGTLNVSSLFLRR